MNYKVLMGYVTTYNCGDTYCNIICPMAFDARHTRTRQAIIEKMKHEVQQSVEDYAGERDLVIEEILEWRLNQFGAQERLVPLNERNNYSLLECGFKEFWGGDLSFCYGIVEIEPEFFKSNESDVKVFADHREITKTIRTTAEIDRFGLSTKDMVWASVLTTLPEWDYDGRDDFNDTIKSLSKNLSGFFIHEKEDLPKIAEEFQRTYIANDDDIDFYIRDHVDWRDVERCIKNHGRMNIEYNCDLEARNDNGFFIGCRFQLIPVVTYYNIGDTECGEN